MRRTDDGVILEDDEPTALARRLIAHVASDWADHFEWEDVPYLIESSWEQVAAEMDELATWLANRADEFDRHDGVDSREMLAQAQTRQPGNDGGES